MKNFFRSAAGAAALLGASSMAVPVQAAPITPSANAPQGMWTIEDETAHGWRHHRRWHRNRVDGGDVLAGILILGGVVAIAKAAENAQERKYRERRDDDYRYRDYDRDSRRPYDSRYDDRRYADNSRRGIEGAIEECVDEVERSERVRSVDTAERDASGWRVEGDLANGGRFDCEIDASGRVRDIDIEIGSRSYGRADETVRPARDSRYGDDYYADARARIDQGSTPAPVEQDAEADDESRTWERGEADDRYETADGPDYALVG
ncbi:hypothetical protein [Croceicoccus sediminis]|uniref:hypothetical protein n=1 Tax=Croceicoccus sediminis TaxID=2571150 RepID=UPI0011832BBB|nr:hypothetical protein [Croceicoccus sediminis]